MASSTVDPAIRVGTVINTGEGPVTVTHVLKHSYDVVGADGVALVLWSWEVAKCPVCLNYMVIGDEGVEERICDPCVLKELRG